ncbi:MAG: hypothetical protein OWP43_10500 [Sphaerochaetaceae bacterium]|nr:hypothetical protein [Sphaerochaetaceae bacterium]
MTNNGLSMLLSRDFFLMVFFSYIVFIPVFIGWLASQKGYSIGTWVILGIFFGIIALLTLGFAPSLKTEKITKSEKSKLDEKNNSVLSSKNIKYVFN